jgi:hypothetical protein
VDALTQIATMTQGKDPVNNIQILAGAQPNKVGVNLEILKSRSFDRLFFGLFSIISSPHIVQYSHIPLLKTRTKKAPIGAIAPPLMC